MENFCQVKGCRFNRSHTTSGHKCGKCGKFGHGIMECNKIDLINFNAKNGGTLLPKNLRCTVPNCPTFWNHTIEAHHCPICQNRSYVECCPIEMKLDCPVCRKENIVNSSQTGITGLEQKCSVCLDNNANVFFENCKHINTCLDCCKKLNKNKTYKIFDINEKIFEEVDCTFDINFDYIRQKVSDKENKIYISVSIGMGCTIFLRRNNKNEKFKLFFMHSDNWGQYGIEVDDRPYLELFKEDYKECRIG